MVVCLKVVKGARHREALLPDCLIERTNGLEIDGGTYACIGIEGWIGCL